MVSDKMIEVCKDTAYAYGPGNITIDIENAQETAQAAIDAAWTEFDPEDKDTWPKYRYPPGRTRWIVALKNGEMDNLTFRLNSNDKPVWSKNVIAYANPRDLAPSFSKKRVRNDE